MGITILAFGNSVGDLSLNISLAKSGYGEMALSGCISGPLFNILVGLGCSLIKLNVVYGNIKFDFYNKSNFISLFSGIFLFFNLIVLLIQTHYSGYIIKKYISYTGFALYAIYFAATTAIAFLIK